MMAASMEDPDDDPSFILLGKDAEEYNMASEWDAVYKICKAGQKTTKVFCRFCKKKFVTGASKIRMHFLTGGDVAMCRQLPDWVRMRMTQFEKAACDNGSKRQKTADCRRFFRSVGDEDDPEDAAGVSSLLSSLSLQVARVCILMK